MLTWLASSTPPLVWTALVAQSHVEPGEPASRWTARVAMTLYLASLIFQLLPNWQALTRWAWPCWAAGAAALWVHIATAFYGQHRGDWAYTYDWTAKKTDAVVGLNWGGGVYISLAFATLWTLDAAFWAFAPQRRANLPLPVALFWHAFALMMIVSATIVFEPGPTRYIAGVAAVGLLALAIWRWSYGRTSTPSLATSSPRS